MNPVVTPSNAPTTFSADTFNDGSPRLDRRDQFSQLLSQALDQQHDGALGVLLEGARSDSDPRMILVVSHQYSHANPGQKESIDRWLDTLSLQQQLDFCEEREFLDHADLLHKLLQKQRNDKVEDLLNGTLRAGKESRYFKEIGRQCAGASGQQKALIDRWQKELSYSQREAYLDGMGLLPKLNTVWQQVADFVDDKTLLSLQLTGKYLGQKIGEGQPGRLIAAKASQLHKLSGAARSEQFLQLRSGATSLSDPHQRMAALKGLAGAVDVRPEAGISEFQALMSDIESSEPEFQVTPLSVLASRLASWPFAINFHVNGRYSSMLHAIKQLTRPEWRLGPLDATVRATTNSPIYSKKAAELLDLFLSMQVEDLSPPHLHTWTQLLRTYFDSGHWVSVSGRKALVEKTQGAIEKLPATQRDLLLPMLPSPQR
ncbi:MAG: hypothetical protein KAF64_19430 [Hydrogenophaga sp.]|uniref:hypothetical protein n=1 Tax=Hydrogenophaga sp. TaxID=1904254 RepID=UPI0025BD6876|nr:hypothetical protein [Hydrogenophaga sp.]MBU7575540.1 hypothetical protein [Hydrogenophaga sp.]